MFRFIITDVSDGVLKGTNDSAKAKQFAECEDYFVYDTVTHVWMLSDGSTMEVEEIK